MKFEIEYLEKLRTCVDASNAKEAVEEFCNEHNDVDVLEVKRCE